jgi:transposase
VDLRERIVAAARGGGQSQKAVADRFAVSTATVSRYLCQYRERGGDLTPKPPPGRARGVSDAVVPELERHLGGHPDATLEQVRAWLAERHGVAVSSAAVQRTLARLGWTHKKSRWSPPSGTRQSAPPFATA